VACSRRGAVPLGLTGNETHLIINEHTGSDEHEAVRAWGGQLTEGPAPTKLDGL